MKVFVGKIGNETEDPIRQAICRIVETAHELIEDPEASELAVIGSAQEALEILKENEEATVAVLVLPGQKNNIPGIRSLQKNFPGRVDLCIILEPEPENGDHSLVPYILGKGGEKK